MVLDREQRSRIRKAILACRRVLTEGFDQQLRYYGFLPDRIVNVPLERQEVQRRLREAVGREAASFQEARKRYLQHTVFTFLNRMLALRMAEANGLVTETVVTRPEYGGYSRRERDLADECPELAAQTGKLQQKALELALSEMQQTMHDHLLFRDRSPYTVLMPELSAYHRVREILMQLPEEVWHEFELLGWAYQFFNSEERREIRQRLRRNPEADDIPPLNQFYTVDWIVRALVENTLGRLWLEMHPDSPLRGKLAYLVPVRNGFRPPGIPLSVEEIKVLDPACGSGHFLLGAFDLLFAMWREERPDLPAWRIPALILEHNLYGVDVDLRACQIAATALWFKARTTFERLKGDNPAARFEPRRINIVCADIRFVDSDRRSRFLQQFAHDPDLRRIVEQTLQACEDAFEIGSLLRIRQPFEHLFRERKKRVNEVRYKQEELQLFVVREEQLSLDDVPVAVPKELTVVEIVDCIKEFVRRASEAQDMGSLLFGLDAEYAVQLVDVLTDCYDVVLMNPPYGAMPPRCKEYARKHYPRTHSDYYAAFIEQAVDLCREGGYVGALTGRTFLFLRSFQKLREEILRWEALPEVVWDLGFNVLDEATARYAAFTLRKRHPGDGVDWENHPVTFFRLTDWDWDEKRIKFEEALSSMKSSEVV